MLIKAVFGLGNPGDRYKNTRHNIGTKAVIEYVQQFQPKARFKEDGFSLSCNLGDHLCVLPQTYMNLSGVAVADIVKHYQLELENCFIVYDDAAIPFGHLRIRQNGSAGGQNGMKSVIEHLQSQQIARLRIGVGHPDFTGDLADFVLNPFDQEEQNQLPKFLNITSKCIASFINKDLNTAMNRFNGAAISD
jgi:PTH1 family peptidyl-tRNA hydrolase